MAQQKSDPNLKRNFLLIFVLIGVILVFMTWAEGLIGEETGTPSYYRGTFVVDQAAYITLTAEAEIFATQYAGTPAPTHFPDLQGGNDQPIVP
ncbi:MAG TPA: hypothetical protein VE136_15980 [Anaerolineales bacterium]|jgi:hypothetical protein|nr:hypothetical protein [Anaerolineales bacterium]